MYRRGLRLQGASPILPKWFRQTPSMLDVGQENLMFPSGTFSSTSTTTTHPESPSKAVARKPLKGTSGAINDFSRARVTKREEYGDDADERDAVSPGFVSAFAAAACVINFGTSHEGARKAPRTLSAVNLVKPRFESDRIADSILSRQEYRGTAVLLLSAGSISITVEATSRPLQPRLVSTPKRTTTSAAVSGSLSIYVSNATEDLPSTSPDAGIEARRSRTGFNSLLEFKSSSKARASILMRVKARTNKSYPVLRRLALNH
jgi:hypothetical protein